MQLRHLWLVALVAAGTNAADTTSNTGSVSTITGTVATSTAPTSITGTYAAFSDQTTVSSELDVVGQGTSTTASSSSSGTATGSTSSITSVSKGSTSKITLLLGGGVGLETLSVINGTTTIYPNSTASATATSSSTSSAAQATNTQPCNGYVEFCDRKYSNITEVCAHNSAFDISGNAASNQKYDITLQLDDGIRMIQGETHLVNNTIYSCHTSCDLLNAGTYQSELETVAAWVRDHPYDVVTILIVNSDYTTVENYVDPIQNSGLAPYLYEPPYIPMRLDQWPTLSELILTQKRVIIFMDYEANQTAVPYILDEFTHMWETPFSPQNRSFPCTVERPPTLTNKTEARDEFMYLANHNLNQDITLLGVSLLLPNTAELNVTNAASDGYGTLGTMAEECTTDWGRAPNFLLVDYYNVGNGSVFEVAAKYNNVTYTAKCCGIATSGASRALGSTASVLIAIATAAFLFLQ